jgi:transposase
MAQLRTPDKPSAVFAGIDWGGSFHQLCLIDTEGRTLLQQRYLHTLEGLEALADALSAQGGTVRAAIERAEGLLVERLLALDIELFCVSPKISARAQERYRMSSKKSDAFDAFVLADTLRHEYRFWRPLRPGSAVLMQLRATIRDREALIWNQRDLENRLRATMEAYNPAVLHRFSTLDREISLQFIRRYPLPAQAERVCVKRMQGFISAEHYSGRAPAVTLVDRIDPHLLSASPGTSQGKAFAAEIARLLALHPDTRIFTGFPGIGPVIAATLLAGMGEDRARYPSAPALLAEAGLAPVTRSSGRTHQVRFRYAANKRLRHAIDWWAFVVVREDPFGSGVLYEQARAAGQGHHRALRGIGARWMRILWRCWRDGREYNPALHPHRWQALQSSEQSPQIPEKATGTVLRIAS